MAKWKDKAIKYNNPEIKKSMIQFGVFRIEVHRNINYPKDKWLASCPHLFSCRELASKDIIQAKAQAKEMLQCILQDAVDEIVKPSGDKGGVR